MLIYQQNNKKKILTIQCTSDTVIFLYMKTEKGMCSAPKSSSGVL